MDKKGHYKIFKIKIIYELALFHTFLPHTIITKHAVLRLTQLQGEIVEYTLPFQSIRSKIIQEGDTH